MTPAKLADLARELGRPVTLEIEASGAMRLGVPRGPVLVARAGHPEDLAAAAVRLREWAAREEDAAKDAIERRALAWRSPASPRSPTSRAREWIAAERPTRSRPGGRTT